MTRTSIILDEQGHLGRSRAEEELEADMTFSPIYSLDSDCLGTWRSRVESTVS